MYTCSFIIIRSKIVCRRKYRHKANLKDNQINNQERLSLFAIFLPLIQPHQAMKSIKTNRFMLRYEFSFSFCFFGSNNNCRFGASRILLHVTRQKVFSFTTVFGNKISLFMSPQPPHFSSQTFRSIKLITNSVPSLLLCP